MAQKYLEMNAAQVRVRGEIPTPGCMMDTPWGDMMVVQVSVENDSKVTLKVINPLARRFDKPGDDSVDWPEIDEKYLEEFDEWKPR